MEKYQEIERSIIKKYRKPIWAKFVNAIQTFDLIEENDKIMVCISGGKDSFLLAKCLEELSRHGKFFFQLHYVVMDPGYSNFHKKQIQQLAQTLNLKIEIFESDIFEVSTNLNRENPCYMCARMRRGCLYNKAQELGCNKIALGHHLNDVIETTLLSMFYGSEIKTMMPKLKSDNFEGLELIRPLYFVKEESILAWAKSNSLSFINCACQFTKNNFQEGENTSKRKEIKYLIQKLKETNPNIENNIMKSLDNVNLDCIIGTKKNKQYHNFLEDYKK